MVMAKKKPRSSEGESKLPEFNDPKDNERKEKEMDESMSSPYWDKYEDYCKEIMDCCEQGDYKQFAKVFYKLSKLLDRLKDIEPKEEAEEETEESMEY